MQAWGANTVEVDIINGTPHADLLDDANWQFWKDKLAAGSFDGLLASPPCGSFCPARRLQPGPPILRSGKYVYGFPKKLFRSKGLAPHHHEELRKANLLAIRCAEACQIMRDLRRPYVVEQPGKWRRFPHMFDFFEFQRLLQSGASTVLLDQCMYEAVSTKPSLLLFEFIECGVLEAHCNHPSRWVSAADGTWTWAAHAPTVGFNATSEPWPTKALAAYPSELNRGLALCFARTLRAGTYAS